MLQRHLPPSAFNIVKLANGLILLAVLFVPLERLFALRPQKILRRGLAADIGFYFLTSLLPNMILALPLALLALALTRAGFAPLQRWSAELPSSVRFAAAMLVAEVGFYWGHRWMHRSQWLWRFHAIHHSAKEMDWLVNTRAHPVDLVLTRLCGYVPIYALGLAQWQVNRVDWVPALVALVSGMWGYFLHANVRFRFGWLEHIVATPGFHHWHHNHEGPEHLHRNYAPTMPWVDRVFGTLHFDGKNWPGEYGTDEQVSSDLTGQLLSPFLATADPQPSSAPRDEPALRADCYDLANATDSRSSDSVRHRSGGPASGETNRPPAI